MQLDRYDLHILDILQKNGRLSNQDLSEMVGLSPSPCLRRVKALEEAGVIVGYQANIDAKKLSLGLLALLQISMDKHIHERFEVFEKSIQDIPEIIECCLMTGQSADYQLKIIVQDLEHYQKVLLNRITKIPGVIGVHSSFVLKQVIQHPTIPIYFSN